MTFSRYVRILFLLGPLVGMGAGCESLSVTRVPEAKPVASSTAVLPLPQKPTATVPSTIEATSTKKWVALTFDDGPYGTSTEKILDILKREQVRATFFVMGKNVLQFPEQVRRELREGHEIGNHSYDHAMNLATMTPEALKENLDKTEAAIESVTKTRPELFRPPYGATSAMMKRVLAEEGYRSYLWTIDPQDWNIGHTSDQIVTNVVSNIRPGSIILMHDGRDTQINYPRDNTIEALPIIIKELKAKGYTFVSLDALPK